MDAPVDRSVEHAAAAAWTSARQYASHLARGGSLARVFAGGVVLEPGEGANFSVAATYERFWGGNGAYRHTSAGFLGSPAFPVAGFTAVGVANSVKKRRALNDAVPTWREAQDATVVATNRRLLAGVAGRGYLSFWWRGMQEFYPEPRSWSMVLVWPDTAPLRLTGLSVPYLCVHVAAHVLPQDWTSHPALAELLAGDGPQDRR